MFKSGYYLTLFDLSKLLKPGKPVLHRETCPECGRTLVNLYRRGNLWRCKRCWDEKGGGE